MKHREGFIRYIVAYEVAGHARLASTGRSAILGSCIQRAGDGARMFEHACRLSHIAIDQNNDCVMYLHNRKTPVARGDLP
jgi:hypothetical protein